MVNAVVRKLGCVPVLGALLACWLAFLLLLVIGGRHGCLMVSMIVSESSGPGSTPGWGTLCCVLKVIPQFCIAHPYCPQYSRN